MNLPQLLEFKRNDLINEALGILNQARLSHYDDAGYSQRRLYLIRLYDLMTQCIEQNDMVPMLNYIKALAEERFTTGFDLSEVQMAFNVMEEVIWKHILSDLPAEKYPEALGMISTVLGTGKDYLANMYVSMASQHKATSIDLSDLYQKAR
ncbi:MAG TPA: hypothetical protein PLL06_13255 [Acidobacteriota bacterium]|nr:hypothetical protein [Acidobacteriota bacterium]HMZ80664.1 hypothetical protein [Acidobacteriota bacterium]HNB71627.1 hypothetical protein [Acidobacteriota bacterium]HND19222.1 hypothetical protein [Acidobacteriota bacterium]HNG92249.1 hypothetical protein [Acidobacteriota bacterium]